GLSETYADGGLTLSQLKKGSERVRTRLADVETKLAAATSGPSADLRALVTSTEVGVTWDELETSTRRAIIGQLMTIRLYPPGRGVTEIRPEHVQIEWQA